MAPEHFFFQDLLGPFPDVLWAPDFLSAVEHAELFEYCRDHVEWQLKDIYIEGRSIPVPRGLAWFGDVPYAYSGLKHAARPMPPARRALADRIEAWLDTQGHPTTFNSVLLNFYRDGADSIGMHADDETQLGLWPVIASVSLGATRNFRFQHKLTRVRHQTPLPGGSLLVMKGATQDEWRHGIPKEPGAGPRINLTFRRTHAA